VVLLPLGSSRATAKSGPAPPAATATVPGSRSSKRFSRHGVTCAP